MTRETLLAAMEELVAEGERIHDQESYTQGSQEWIHNRPFVGWTTRVRNIINQACGTSSVHAQHASGLSTEFWSVPRLEEFQGILDAAYGDVKQGLLVSMQAILAAEIFNDLLEMAKHLQDSGYFLPAVAIAGGVLEDSLRKLHNKHLPSMPTPDQINPLNEALWQNGVYPQPQWREVQAWADLRNAADHLKVSNSASLKVTDQEGNPRPDIDPRQVARMIDGVRDFIVKYLT